MLRIPRSGVVFLFFALGAIALVRPAQPQQDAAQGGIRVVLPGDVAVSRCLMTVCSEDGQRFQTGSLGDTVTLPAGRYQFVELRFSAREGKKDWSYSFRTEDYKPTKEAVPVQAGRATLLKPKVVVGVSGSGTGRDYALSLAAVGPLGMRLSDATVGEERPPAPKFELRDARGKSVARGEFEYG